MAEFFKGAHWKVCPIIFYGVMTILTWHSVGCLLVFVNGGNLITFSWVL